jgi:hypothetical protein
VSCFVIQALKRDTSLKSTAGSSASPSVFLSHKTPVQFAGFLFLALPGSELYVFDGLAIGAIAGVGAPLVRVIQDAGRRL